jgi:hypothetical protein
MTKTKHQTLPHEWDTILECPICHRRERAKLSQCLRLGGYPFCHGQAMHVIGTSANVQAALDGVQVQLVHVTAEALRARRMTPDEIKRLAEQSQEA